MKIILFNSPPKSGKDVCVSYLDKAFDVFPFSFKTQLKAITLAIYAVSDNQWAIWYSDREQKELPRPELGGLSCRGAFIDVSERVIKPMYGKDFFGVVEAKKLLKHKNVIVAAASDAGFIQEMDPLIDAFGANNIHIVYIDRDGCTFEGDSRTWVAHPEVPHENYFTIDNNGTLEDLYTQLDNLYFHVMSK